MDSLIKICLTVLLWISIAGCADMTYRLPVPTGVTPASVTSTSTNMHQKAAFVAVNGVEISASELELPPGAHILKIKFFKMIFIPPSIFLHETIGTKDVSCTLQEGVKYEVKWEGRTIDAVKAQIVKRTDV